MKTFAMASISMQASNNRDRLVVIFLLVVSFDFVVGDSCIPPCQPGYVCCGGGFCAFSRCTGRYCVVPSQCSSGESCCHSRCVDHLDCSGQPCTHESDCGGETCCRGTRRFWFATGHFTPNSHNIVLKTFHLLFVAFRVPYHR